MKVTVIPNMTRLNALDVTENLIKELEKNNIDYTIDGKTEKYFPEKSNFKFGDISVSLEASDFVIAVGGDGTIISAAKSAAEYDIPVLGINAGNLAYLMGLENDELNLISGLADGSYQTEERIMLNVSVVRNGEELNNYNCINDVILARGKKIQITSVNVKYNDYHTENYKCDGILVATPTGSTAYNFSAGGPVIEPEVDAFILTPICPHSLTARPFVCSSDSIITLSCAEDNRSDLFLSCDGGEGISIDDSYEIIVSKSELKPKFIKLKKESFLDILYIKLNDRDVR